MCSHNLQVLCKLIFSWSLTGTQRLYFGINLRSRSIWANSDPLCAGGACFPYVYGSFPFWLRHTKNHWGDNLPTAAVS